MSRLMAPSSPRETLRLGHGLGRLVLAGVGAFLAAASLLLRFYAAPRLIAAPADLYQTDTLLAEDASYFDEGSLTTRRGVTLTYTLTIRGDPGASTSTTAVWDSFADLEDLKRGVQVNSTYQRAVFNRRTGQLLDCCGAAVNDDTRVRQHGIGLFWPIGVRKATYVCQGAQESIPISAVTGGVAGYFFVRGGAAGLRTRQGWAAPDGGQALMRSRPAGLVMPGDGRQIDSRPARMRQPNSGPGRPRSFGR